MTMLFVSCWQAADSLPRSFKPNLLHDLPVRRSALKFPLEGPAKDVLFELRVLEPDDSVLEQNAVFRTR